jgi:rSAM/selenodomain-associated transferase 1
MATGRTLNAGVQVAVFAKAPCPGLAKTRLAPALGCAGAARLQRQLTLRSLATARAAAIGPVTLWCAPDTRHRFFRALRRVCRLPCHDQRGEDLGARMAACFRQLLTNGPALLMGTDCPALTPSHLRAAAAALGRVDAFFYPATDGGYVLVGLGRFGPSVFDGIRWGTASVMQETRRELTASGWSWSEGETLQDIDEVEDLAHLPEGLRTPAAGA